jgi:amidase
MDYPGVVFPVGQMKADQYNSRPLRSHPRNPTEQYVHAQWSPGAFEGAPISLQLVGRRHGEEKLLAMLSRVEDARKQFVQRE